jgi:DNA-binding CsgD family transcriptional regulator
MRSKLKPTGVFCGCLFFAAALLNLLIAVVDGNSFIHTLMNFRDFLSLVLIAILLFLSAYVPVLAWIQPIVFLAMTPFPLMDASSSFYGLGFYAVGILLLFKLDFYKTHRIVKVICSVVYLMAFEVLSILWSGSKIYSAFTPVLYIIAFILFLYLAFRDRIFVYLKEPKPKLSLAEKGLSDAERLYCRAILAGKSVKDTSIDSGVSESTVRNTLARAYKKLGISSRSELMSLAGKYDVVI